MDPFCQSFANHMESFPPIVKFHISVIADLLLMFLSQQCQKHHTCGWSGTYLSILLLDNWLQSTESQFCLESERGVEDLCFQKCAYLGSYCRQRVTTAYLLPNAHCQLWWLYRTNSQSQSPQICLCNFLFNAYIILSILLALEERCKAPSSDIGDWLQASEYSLM